MNKEQKSELQRRLELRNATCRRIFATHRGVITREQAYLAGHDKYSVAHVVARGVWHQVAPDVFALSGQAPSFEQACEAAVAWAGRDAALCRETAAWAWGLRRAPPKSPQVALTRSSRAVPFDTFKVDSLANDVRRCRGWPVTSVERTLRDLVVDRDEDAIDNLLWDSFRKNLTTPEKLEGYLRANGVSGRRGIKVLRDALTRGRLPARSILEARMSRLMHDAGLPRPLSLLRVYSNDAFIHEIDFAYPEVALAIEVDGFRWHAHRIAFIKDRLQANKLTLLGWRILRFTWQQLRRQKELVISQIRAALGPIDAIPFLLEHAPAREPPRWFTRGEPPDLQQELFQQELFA